MEVRNREPEGERLVILVHRTRPEGPIAGLRPGLKRLVPPQTVAITGSVTSSRHALGDDAETQFYMLTWTFDPGARSCYLRFFAGRVAIIRTAPSMRRVRVSGFLASSRAWTYSRSRRTPHVERHADPASRRCPNCGIRLWPRAIPRKMRALTTYGILPQRSCCADAHSVQRVLRHADLRTTLGTYGHLTAEDLRAAVNQIGPPVVVVCQNPVAKTGR